MLKGLKNRKAVFVGMSGGVDSSVAALLLKEKGYDVVGIFMHCYNVDGCAEKDATDALLVAQKLEIPFYVWDFKKEYKKKVVDYMVEGYRKGLTPNPDVMCNKEIKFGLFLEKALKMGADYVATGHYAKLEARNMKHETKKDNREKLNATCYMLRVARDKNKDQSYFLWTLTQERLKHCLFPIGDYLKPKVREIAKKAGLPTAEKKDSQGICFLGKIKLEDFLKQYIPEKKGKILTTEGRVIGEHHGSHFYTIGQRNLGVSGAKPFYVAEKDVKSNMLVVAEGSENKALYKKELELEEINWISGSAPKLKEIFARVRYRQPLVKAALVAGDSGIKLKFGKPVKFAAPGQSAVLYSKNKELLGGGVIK